MADLSSKELGNFTEASSKDSDSTVEDMLEQNLRDEFMAKVGDGKYKEVPKEPKPLTEFQKYEADIEAGIESKQVKQLQEGSSQSPVVQNLLEARYSAALKDKEYTESLLSDAWSTTAASDIITQFNRTVLPVDPTYKVQEHLPALMKDLPAELMSAFQSASSAEEAGYIREGLLKDREVAQRMANAGWKGVGAQILAGIADIDAPLMALSFGAGYAAKFGTGAAKAATAMKLGAQSAERAALAAKATGVGAVEGALGGALTGSVSAVLDPNMDTADAVIATMSGMMFGAGVGGLIGSKLKANNSLKVGIADFVEMKDDVYLHMNMNSTTTTKVFGDNDTEWSEMGKTISSKGFSNFKDSVYLKKTKEFFEKYIPLFDTDADILYRSKSDTATALSYGMFESSSGVARNDKSASILAEMWNAQASYKAIPNYHNSYTAYVTDTGGSSWDKFWGGDKQVEFNDLVVQEMERRYYNKPMIEPVHPRVKEACDRFDEANEMVLKKAQETGVEGFETLEIRSGYMPHKLDGVKTVQAIKKAGGGAKGESVVAELFKKALLNMRDDLPDHVAAVMAKAFVSRAKAMHDGLDMQVLNLINSDSSAFIRETLKNNGVQDKLIDEVVDALTVNVKDRGKISYGKHRVSLDFNVTHEGLTLRDIFDTDIPRLYGNYYRNMSRGAGMAAQGIGSRTKLNRIFEQILREDPDFGKSYRKFGYSDPMEVLKKMFGEFSGEAVDTGINPMARRAMQAVTLSTLNMVGLAQLGETGAQIAAVGLGNWIQALPVLRKTMLGTKEGKDALAEELGMLAGHLAEEYKYFRADLQLDWNKHATVGDIWGTYDHFTAKLQQLQGYTSMMNTIKKFQTETLSMAYVNQVMRLLKDDKFSQAQVNRLIDEGLEPSVLSRIKERYIDTGKVQWLPRGHVDRLNLKDWANEDREVLLGAITRMTFQNIQKGMLGERLFLTRGTTMALLTQLKQFPMMAVQKQLFRHLAHNDSRTYQTLMLGLMTAGIGYSVRQTINGNYDKLDADSIYKGAITMSNMTGWLPMLVDPLASLLGMNKLQFDDYGVYAGVDFSLMPAFTIVPQMMAAPQALVKGVTGNASKEDLTSISRVWLLGNAYGARMFADAVFKQD